MNWTEFFSMGGYGWYVWGSYGFAAIVLVANVVAAMHKKRTAIKVLKELMSMEVTERI